MRDDWLLLALGEVATRSTQKNSALLDRVLTVSAEHGLIEQELFFTKRVASKNLSGYSVVAPGVFVYNKSYSVKAPMGVIARNRDLQAGVVSPLYIIFQANEDKILLEFLEMATNSALFHTSLEGFIKEGGRAHGGITISLGDFFGAALLVPPLEEQRRIVDVVESVDNYIAALQARVDAARIARNAVLHELLNAGGDGWVETTLGEVAKFVGERLSPTTIDSETYYVGLEHIVPHTLKVLSTGRTAEVTSHVTPFSEGDVLFGRLRPYLHKVAIADFAGFCSPEILVLRANKKCLPSLLHMFCDRESTIKSCVEMSAGTRMPRTSQGDLARVEISLPPLVEQQRIVEVVSSMDDSIQATEQTIVEAKNLRSGLLSDLLSGEHEIPAAYDKLLGAA